MLGHADMDLINERGYILLDVKSLVRPGKWLIRAPDLAGKIVGLGILTDLVNIQRYAISACTPALDMYLDQGLGE